MSRVTLFSFLLALLLGVGIYWWSIQQSDACTAYLDGNAKAPKTIWVVSGSRQIEVSCNNWIARQPLTVQILCMVDVTLFIVFVLNGLSDLQQRRAAQRRMGGFA